MGSKGETLAADYLKAKGYRILERRYRAAGGEIDLVAEKEGCVAFVEVKTSQSSILDYNPEERVATRKKNHLVRASRIYLQDRQTKGGAYRFDVIAVGLQGEAAPQIHHLEAAFEAPPF